jgi:hypothetical protein
MVRKIIAGTVAVAFLVLAPAGIANAKNGVQDNLPQHSGVDQVPGHN